MIGHAILLGALGIIAGLELRRRGHPYGQALVEFALVAPLLMFILLGFGEAAALVATRTTWQDRTDAYAERLAADPLADPAVLWAALDTPPECRASPAVTWLLGDPGAPGAVLRAGVTCAYVPRITSNLWNGLPVSLSADAVVWAPTPTPIPDPTEEVPAA